MFENAKPPAIPSETSHTQHVSARGDAVNAIPLRAMEWNELTARLTAARDLRQILREDLGSRNGAKDLGFAEAAAQFFRASADDERCVNPNALEGRKASSGMEENLQGQRDTHVSSAEYDSADGVADERCEPGDAREER